MPQVNKRNCQIQPKKRDIKVVCLLFINGQLPIAEYNFLKYKMITYALCLLCAIEKNCFTKVESP